jgi:hypothetical protein
MRTAVQRPSSYLTAPDLDLLPEAMPLPVVDLGEWWSDSSLEVHPEWKPQARLVRQNPRDGRWILRDGATFVTLEPNPDQPGQWSWGRRTPHDPRGEFAMLSTEIGRGVRHERIVADPVTRDLDRLAESFPDLAQALRAQLDKDKPAATRLPDDRFVLGEIIVDRRVFDHFDVNEILGRHAQGHLGEHGRLEDAPELDPFVKFAPPLGSPIEQAQAALSAGYGLIRSEHARHIEGRGVVRARVVTLVDEQPQTIVIFQHM